MPIKFQHPKPGVKVKVIGAGLPRTATNSFCAAVSYLLDGPAYHAGAQYATGETSDETHILTLIDATKNFPYTDPAEKKRIMSKLERLLDGYVVTTDSGLNCLVPELMELYPDAKVICTTRSRTAWANSMLALVKSSQPALAGFIFFFLPSVRHLPALTTGLSNIYQQRYGCTITDMATALRTYDRNVEHLQIVVPREKLIWYDIKDGWEPLCQALGVPVPEGVPFPRLNDQGDMEAHFRKLAAEGLIKWAMVLIAVIGIIAACYTFVRRI